MDDTISIATGSVAGRVHRKLCRPNQDAVATERLAGGGVVMVVCDGCGSAPRSEVGAALGARLWVRALASRIDAGAAAATWFDEAGADVIATLGLLAEAMAPDAAGRAQIVLDHFMFTTLAAVVHGDLVRVHAVGDGVVVLGDAVHVVGPFPDNQPPYLAQALLGATPERTTWLEDTGAIDRVIVASDGATGLLDGAGLDAFAGDVVFKNPAALTRKLALLAEDTTEIDWDARRVERRAARLDDDTTIAMARWAPRRSGS